MAHYVFVSWKTSKDDQMIIRLQVKYSDYIPLTVFCWHCIGTYRNNAGTDVITEALNEVMFKYRPWQSHWTNRNSKHPHAPSNNAEISTIRWKSRITITQPNEATECVRRQKKRTHRSWYTGRTEGGGGSAGKQAASQSHLKLPQLNKITAGKQKVHQKKFRTQLQCILSFSFSFTHSIYFPFPSPSPFSRADINLHIHTLLPRLNFLLLFYLHRYVSFCSPPNPSSLLHCNTFSFSFFFFSGRELGPSLGCCWPGLLAAK